MATRALKAAKVYLHFLKAVKKHIGNEEHKRRFQDFLTGELRKKNGGGGEELSDWSSIRQKMNTARYYTFTLNSVHHHKDILILYNSVVARSDDVKRILGKSAASLGRQLPDVCHP